MFYRIKYKVEPFVDTFYRTVEADNDDIALKIWKASSLSYDSTFLGIEEVSRLE